MRLNALRQNNRGVAAIEFALSAPFLLTMLAGISDLGLAMRSQMQLASGVANAAQYEYLYYQSNHAAAPAATMSTIVQNAANLTGVSVTTAALAYYCASGTPASLVSSTSGSTCANGASAGGYVKITATYNYTPLMTGYAFVANTTLTETSWVQVK